MADGTGIPVTVKYYGICPEEELENSDDVEAITFKLSERHEISIYPRKDPLLGNVLLVVSKWPRIVVVPSQSNSVLVLASGEVERFNE